jgi:hypothetical protein
MCTCPLSGTTSPIDITIALLCGGHTQTTIVQCLRSSSDKLDQKKNFHIKSIIFVLILFIWFFLRHKGHQTRMDILVTCQPNQSNQINKLFTLLMEIKLDQSVGSKDTICSCAYYQEILISWILWELCPFELRNFPKFSTEAACQCNSSETTEQNHNSHKI